VALGIISVIMTIALRSMRTATSIDAMSGELTAMSASICSGMIIFLIFVLFPYLLISVGSWTRIYLTLRKPKPTEDAS